MGTGRITVYSGEGHGKTPAALGRALQCASEGGSVMVIQFLKGKGLEESEYVKRLEPELRIFHFEKSNYDDRTEEEKQDELINIRNGLNFARKILDTAECDLLVMDEVLGLVQNGCIPSSELGEILARRGDTDVILTGISTCPEVCRLADEITELRTADTNE